MTGDTCSFCYVLGLTASVTHKGHNDPSVPHYFHQSVKIIIIRADPARAWRLQVYIRRPANICGHLAGREVLPQRSIDCIMGNVGCRVLGS